MRARDRGTSKETFFKILNAVGIERGDSYQDPRPVY